MKLTVPIPDRMQRLPLDPKRGLPVPWFVAWFDENKEECRLGTGTPEFRVIGRDRVATAHNEGRCWTCGETLGSYKAFVVGPMCGINRTSSEPPGHFTCAVFSAKACPFLSNPEARRRTSGMPKDSESVTAGLGIARNPGVTLVWVTRKYMPFRVPAGAPGKPGVLFNIGEPSEVMWFAEGREATRAEVKHSIDTGLPFLREMCDTDRQPVLAHQELDSFIARLEPHLPR
jgi:hypothetical protein